MIIPYLHCVQTPIFAPPPPHQIILGVYFIVRPSVPTQALHGFAAACLLLLRRVSLLALMRV